MNILIISQCNKNALKETRRIVDQFAERTGDRAWQTEITLEGLQTLKSLLRKTARKNTAVACFWMRGRHLTKLLWVVGNKKQFNEEGRTPTNRTRRNILRSQDENRWDYLSSIQIMSVLGALLHDLGKATEGFDNKLREQSFASDPYRHEWLSLCLFKNMIQGCTNNQDVLERLHTWDDFLHANKDWYKNLVIDESSSNFSGFAFDEMPPLAQWLAWLIVSHHRMPKYDPDYYQQAVRSTLKKDNDYFLHNDIKAFFNELKPVDSWVKNSKSLIENKEKTNKFFKLKKDPTRSKFWQKDLKRWSRKALEDNYLLSLSDTNMLWNPLHLHLSRLCLMIGDHNYSSLSSDSSKRILDRERLSNFTEIAQADKTSKTELWANLNGVDRTGRQFLDEHLVGVSRMAASFSRYLPFIKTELNALKNHTTFRKRSTNQRFAWQDKACDRVKLSAKDTEERGFFGVNIASTGTGKTLANAKIMTALAGDNGSTRLTFALGLRVLTSQTGNALRKHFELDEESLATLIGGVTYPSAVEEDKYTKSFGSESSAHDLFFDEGEFFDIVDEGGLDEDIFGTIIRDTKTKQLLMTPWICCTIDHLMQLCEQQRGGRYMAPLLRVLSSDLILDEPDDFGSDDLPALSRLVYWAGMLGSRVMISSATITKDMAVGLHKSYEDGRKIWNLFLGLPTTPTICAWFDEFNQHVETCTNEEFSTSHQKFCEKRISKLLEQNIRRRADWLPFKSVEKLSTRLMEGLLTLHETNGQCLQKSLGLDKKISVGLIRFANINSMMKALQNFMLEECPKDTMIHVVPYHSQQLLLLRSRLEETLDRLLNRQMVDSQYFQPEIQAEINHVNHKNIKNHIFIVFGSPVTEVGRDHDYDWAIIEPSSMRSIIQLVGRVWRHRPEKIAEKENVLILNQNILASKITTGTNNILAYTRPGYETAEFRLANYDLTKIVDEEEIKSITSIPRLLKEESSTKTTLTPAKKTINKYGTKTKKEQQKSDQHSVKNGLADLEHRVMKALLNNEKNFVSLYRAENNAATLTCHHSLISPFRKEEGYQESYVALLDDNKEYGLHFKTYVNAKMYHDNDEKPANNLFKFVKIDHTHNIKPWLVPNVPECLESLAEQLSITVEEASLKFSTVNLRELDKADLKWSFHPWGGFWMEK